VYFLLLFFLKKKTQNDW